MTDQTYPYADLTQWPEDTAAPVLSGGPYSWPTMPHPQAGQLLNGDEDQAVVPQKIWGCKIGQVSDRQLPPGADLPMRQAVERAYREVTGHEPMFIFSGWATELTESEQAVVDDREPSDEHHRQWLEREV